MSLHSYLDKAETHVPEDDHSFGPDARRRAVDILVEAKTEYTMVLFGGISHGFATRADPSVPKQRGYLLFTILRGANGRRGIRRVGKRTSRGGGIELV